MTSDSGLKTNGYSDQRLAATVKQNLMAKYNLVGVQGTLVITILHLVGDRLAILEAASLSSPDSL